MAASVYVILVPDPGGFAFARRAFAGMVAAAHELNDVQLAIGFADESWQDTVRYHRAAGAIVRPTYKHDVPPMLESGIPLVSYLNSDIVKPFMPIVVNDDDQIGRLAAEHLLAMGHRSFAIFAGADMRASFFKPRIDGFLRTVRASGFDVIEGPDQLNPDVVLDEPVPDGAPRWDENAIPWLHSLPKPVGVFAPYDYYGYLAINYCRQAGLSVPREVAVVGVDDDDVYCPASSPPLSSVATPAYEIGRRALLTLHGMLQGTQPARAITQIPPIGLVARSSSSMEAVADADVRDALYFIRQNAGKITVSDVVERALLSRRSIERRFMAAIGRTINDQIRYVRVEHAKRLLAETDLPISIIAQRCGLRPQQRLNYEFRALTGQTPTAFRGRFHPARA